MSLQKYSQLKESIQLLSQGVFEIKNYVNTDEGGFHNIKCIISSNGDYIAPIIVKRRWNKVNPGCYQYFFVIIQAATQTDIYRSEWMECKSKNSFYCQFSPCSQYYVQGIEDGVFIFDMQDKKVTQQKITYDQILFIDSSQNLYLSKMDSLIIYSLISKSVQKIIATKQVLCKLICLDSGYFLIENLRGEMLLLQNTNLVKTSKLLTYKKGVMKLEVCKNYFALLRDYWKKFYLIFLPSRRLIRKRKVHSESISYSYEINESIQLLRAFNKREKVHLFTFDFIVGQRKIFYLNIPQLKKYSVTGVVSKLLVEINNDERSLKYSIFQ